VRIGILGAARIAPKALIDPARVVGGVEVAAVAARDLGRAQAFAAAHRIPTVHGSYAELIADPELDAVYVALPASEHAQWSIAALEAGRHVLCEKPFALNAGEAEQMVAVAERTGRELVEAFHWRYHPMAARLIELGAAIGPLEWGVGTFDAPIPPDDIRFQLALGGGATMDLGCYPIHWLRTVTGDEPDVLRASAVEGPPGVDVAMEADLRFPSGLEATMRCSMAPGVKGLPDSAVLELRGEAGSFTAHNPLAPQFGNRIDGAFSDGTVIDEVIDAGTSYEHQLRAFAAAVAGEAVPITGGADAIATMRVIDAVYEASGLGARG
jgi:predicted dehydrogenase